MATAAAAAAAAAAHTRVAQLPKFAVVDVMIQLSGRICLASDRYDVKDAFWKSVLRRLNELYPDNVSEVRTVNHVKRTWSALRQRVLQRFESNEGAAPTTSSDRRVLYLLGQVDTYEEEGEAAGQPGAPLAASIAALSPALTIKPPHFAASEASSLLGIPLSSPETTVTSRSLEPLLDAMIVSGGRGALGKRRSTHDGRHEYKHFWNRVFPTRFQLLLQFNPQFTGRAILSLQRAWHNARTLFAKRLQSNERDNLPVERKALYLMRVLNLQQACLDIHNGIVRDTLADANNHAASAGAFDNAKVCDILKTEPLTAELLASLARNFEAAAAPADCSGDGMADVATAAAAEASDGIGEVEKSASMSPPPPSSRARANGDLEHRLILCRIEREKAQTELLLAQRRLVEAQLLQLDKCGERIGGVDMDAENIAH